MPVTNAQDMAKAGSLINSDGTTVSVAADLLIADKLVHTGDTNTAIRFPAADTVTVETSGAERMRIDSSGNVGIGTTSPSDILHVSKANGVSIFESTGVSSVGIRLRTNSTDRWQIGCPSASADLAIYTGAAATERLRIDSLGNVGIGTTNPTNRLTVRDSTDISMDAAGSGQFMVEGNGYSTAIAMNATGTFIYNNGSGRVMAFGVNEVERLRIDSSGNVGIGETNPSQKLVVVGSSSSTEVIRVVTGSNSGVQQTTGIGFAFSSGVTNPSALIHAEEFDSIDSRADIVFSTNSTNTDVAPTERMRLSSAGYLGINTASPVTPLHVNGTIRYTNRPATGTITAIGFDANGDLRASSSSSRYKHDINNYGKGLAEVMQLRPVSFKFNGEDRTNIGFIAEEVDAIGLSEVMLYDGENRPEGVIYSNMVSLLTKAIQEQQAMIVELEAKVTALEAA